MTDINFHSIQAFSMGGHAIENTLIPRVQIGDRLRMEFTPTQEHPEHITLFKGKFT